MRGWTEKLLQLVDELGKHKKNQKSREKIFIMQSVSVSVWYALLGEVVEAD